MKRLQWRPMAINDHEAIMLFIAQDDPAAAIELDIEFEAMAKNARQQPTLYQPGRM